MSKETEEDTLEEFISRDIVTGKKIINPLNKKKLSKEDMNDIFLGDE
jgi:hypothetical protein